MAKVGLARAAALTGKSPSTIHRAMRKGRLSFETDEHGTRLIDVAELDRVFGPLSQPIQERNATTPLRETLHGDAMEAVQLRADLAIAQARAAMLEERLRDAQGRADELREERNHWRMQAQRVLVDQRSAATSGRSQRRWWPWGRSAAAAER